MKFLLLGKSKMSKPLAVALFMAVTVAAMVYVALSGLSAARAALSI